MASAACRSVSVSGPSAMAMRITSARYHSLAWMASCDPTWFRAGRIASMTFHSLPEWARDATDRVRRLDLRTG